MSEIGFMGGLKDGKILIKVNTKGGNLIDLAGLYTVHMMI